MQLLRSLPLPARSAWDIQRAVLFALFVRDMRARVQGRWLGLLWMVLEPLAHVLLIMALFSFRRSGSSSDYELPVFLVTGLMPFFMFRGLARRASSAVGSNRGLFSYRQVRPMDALIASACVEILLHSAVYAAALVLLGWFDFHWWPRAPLELMATSALLIVFGAALGVVFAVLSHDRPRVNAVIGLLFFPLYLLSGVIFPLHTLPTKVIDWLLLNPVLHLIELGRHYFIPNYEMLNGVTMFYPFAWALATSALAMAMYRVYRHRFTMVD